MKPTKRTQPYRANRGRPAGRTLAAMLTGKPGLSRHPSTSKRRLRKMRGRVVRSKGQNRA